MDFDYPAPVLAMRQRLEAFMDRYVLPYNAAWHQSVAQGQFPPPFMADLKEQGNADRVVVMTFSEFGRRVNENASGGTDHGQGSCLFVLGQPVKGGLVGKHPSLTDLSQGDLKFTTDFRSIYATVLEDWLKTPSKPVLKGSFEKLGFMG